MIDELSGERLTIRGNFLLVATSQRSHVEKILRDIGASAEWSPATSAVEPYNNDSRNDSGQVAVWSVFIRNVDADKLQLALDQAN